MSFRVYINYFTNSTRFWFKVGNNLYVHGGIKLGNGGKYYLTPITQKIKNIYFKFDSI
jgi:hypothetical protein